MGDSNNSQSEPRGFNALKQHCIANKISVALWAIRNLTIIFTLAYLIPIFGNPYKSYYRALLAHAATSALRLHQRLPRVQFTKEFLAELFLEDSCHYLFYSLIFLYVSPVSLVLLPVVLFAVIHSASYSLVLLDTLGQNSWWGARLLISLIEFQSRNILRLIAFVEIILMPYTVLLILMGRAGLLTPFIYYHFLVQRYHSRRNPYTRNMFRELRLSIENIAQKPNIPWFVRTALLSIVSITLKLNPAQMQANQAPAQ